MVNGLQHALQRGAGPFASAMVVGRSGFQLDLEKGILTFTDPKRRVIFNIRVIGSVRHAARSWEWAWYNPTIPTQLKVPAERLHELESATIFGI